MSKQYNPNAIRRNVRRTIMTGQQQHFVTKSFTRENVEHTPIIDFVTGGVHCTCEDFTYRHAKHEPTMCATQHHCKHITRAIENAVRNGVVAKRETVKPDFTNADVRREAIEAMDAF